MAVVSMVDMATTMARDLLMLNLKLILMLKLVCFMEVMVDTAMAVVSMEAMADMVLVMAEVTMGVSDTAVGTLVVMDMEDTEDITDKESNL